MKYFYFTIQYSEAVIQMCSVKLVLKNFTKFTGKHLCQSLFFNKIAALRPATLLKKSPWHRCFPVKVVKFPRTSFLTEHIWWLLLNIHCACFSSIKKIVFTEKIYHVKFNSIKKYLLIKQKRKNSKTPERI